MGAQPLGQGRQGRRGSTSRPREGAGAIKLRIDVQRVARVARFTNDLTEEERVQIMQLLGAERRAAAGGMPACSTQLCAILALLDKGRAGDDQDFALYLASAVNNSESLVAAERSQRRCRQLFVDQKVLLEGIERISMPGEGKGGKGKGGGGESASASPMRRRPAAAAQRHPEDVAVCLVQMAADPAMVPAAIVYGFAKRRTACAVGRVVKERGEREAGKDQIFPPRRTCCALLRQQQHR